MATHAHALLGDAPGLGKTLQAIRAAQIVGARRNAVACPASVRMGWKQEIFECLSTNDGWDIMSYNEAVRRRRELTKYDALFLDEEQFLKTVDSQRTQAIFGAGGLARRAHFKWALTGTPVLNRPVELYPILKTLGSHVLGPYDTFGKFTTRFCAAHWGARGLDVRGASNLDDLSQRLGNFMLRRTKAEVMPELPPVIIKRVPLELSAADNFMIEEVERGIEDRESCISNARENFSQLGDLSTLMRVTGEAKVGASLKFINDQLQTIDKVVVFARHRNVVAALSDGLTALGHGNVVYQGGMSDGAKHNAISEFVDDPTCRVFVGNLAAAGTGINRLQTVCSNLDFVELPWVPDEMTQGIGRLDRMGQEADSVNVNVLHAPGTIEAAVLGVHEGKTAVIEKLMGTPSAWS